jgi:hypothetical protein
MDTLAGAVELLFEVPRAGPRYADRLIEKGPYVPDVRGWVLSADGILLQAHHQYPDGSICAFMPGEWILGIDCLTTLADSFTMWVAKALHAIHLDRWPGPQHHTARISVQRNRPDELCRCGKIQPWRDCHMEEDLGRVNAVLADGFGSPTADGDSARGVSET